jgi:hypothetical protein
MRAPRSPGRCVPRQDKSFHLRHREARKVDAKTGKRRNLGTFASLAAAKKHEREVQYFKRH